MLLPRSLSIRDDHSLEKREFTCVAVLGIDDLLAVFVSVTTVLILTLLVTRYLSIIESPHTQQSLTAEMPFSG